MRTGRNANGIQGQDSGRHRAGSGAGKATATAFAAAGANVALLDIDADAAQVVADRIDASGTAVVYAVDMAQPSAVQDTLRTVHDRFGRLDAVANVAAIIRRQPF